MARGVQHRRQRRRRWRLSRDVLNVDARPACVDGTWCVEDASSGVGNNCRIQI